MIFHRLAVAQEAAKQDENYVLPSWVRAFEGIETATSNIGGALEDIWIVRPEPQSPARGCIALCHLPGCEYVSQ